MGAAEAAAVIGRRGQRAHHSARKHNNPFFREAHRDGDFWVRGVANSASVWLPRVVGRSDVASWFTRTRGSASSAMVAGETECRYLGT